MNQSKQKKILLPLLPIREAVLFPNLSLQVKVTDPLALKSVEKALSSADKMLLVTGMQKSDNQAQKFDVKALFLVGSTAVITHMLRIENGASITLAGLERVKFEHFGPEQPYLSAEAISYPSQDSDDPAVEALYREILKDVDQIRIHFVTGYDSSLFDVIQQLKNRIIQFYLIAMVLEMNHEKQQALLEAPTFKDAAELMHQYIAYELQVLKVRSKIAQDVTTEFNKEQRDFMLRRQLHQIRKELGDEQSEKDDLQKLHDRSQAAMLPDSIKQEVEHELEKIARLGENSPEYQVHRSHVELMLDLPWQEQTQDNLDLDRAEAILNEDHFGLKDVKQRILEHLAIMRLNPQTKAPILCFLGPPGVGKTSLGQSIARSLGRKFERMSLGGLHDEAELRGHRRTYIGAMPGRILNAIRRAKVNNPLIMLDEIDKLRADFSGDPAAALMEILDPEQNHEFHDNYLDLAFDLSKVFFITTANTTDRILQALLDRMEVIELSGYSDDEKMVIARRYLLPRQIQSAGLKEDQIDLPDATLAAIIHDYTREAGVRELERCLGKITRKIALRTARGLGEPVQITVDQLFDALGNKQIFLEQSREKWTQGIATGLAWTEAGGDIIYVETQLLPRRKNDLKITGHLGEVMMESVQTAISCIWSRAEIMQRSLDPSMRSGLHIHIPAGAIPKDGPSAGLAIAIALASLYSGQAVRKDIAMTGEITLSGLVLPVGGIKQKVLGAHRAGIRCIILPKSNTRQLDELPEAIRCQMQFLAVDELDEAIQFAIPELLVRMPETQPNQAVRQQQAPLCG